MNRRTFLLSCFTALTGGLLSHWLPKPEKKPQWTYHLEGAYAMGYYATNAPPPVLFWDELLKGVKEVKIDSRPEIILDAPVRFVGTSWRGNDSS